jgi:hypothetical protein
MGHRSDQNGSNTIEGYAKFDPKFRARPGHRRLISTSLRRAYVIPIVDTSRRPAVISGTAFLGRNENRLTGTFLENGYDVAVLTAADDSTWLAQARKFLRSLPHPADTALAIQIT